MFCVSFHITLLQYYFKGRKLLGIIPSFYSDGFPLPNASVKSILSAGNFARIPSADILPADQVGFMTSLSNPSSSSVLSWLMPRSSSSCTFPPVDTQQFCSTIPHLHKSNGFRALPQCWKTHYVYFCQLLGSLSRGGWAGLNWAMFLETKPREQRQDKQTHWFARTGLEIRIYKYPHVLFLLNIYTKTE